MQIKIKSKEVDKDASITADFAAPAQKTKGTIDAILQAIKSEADADSMYEQLAKSVIEDDVAELLREISNDEKQHLGQLINILTTKFPQYSTKFEDGVQENKELFSQTIEACIKENASANAITVMNQIEDELTPTEVEVCAKIFDKSKYSMYQVVKPFTVTTSRGKVIVEKGTQLGVRPATSKKGVYRFVDANNVNRVFSVNEQALKRMSRNLKYLKGKMNDLLDLL